MIKKAKLRFLSFLMAIMMVVTMFPVTTNATETENVYISVSYDGKYIDDKNDTPMAYIPVSFESLETVDLDEYGLSEYIYDENRDGTPEITALHLVIYAHENIYGGEWSDVTFTGAPGSSYFQGGIFGFDENLNYYLNGQYPLAGAGWGATSDQIVLKAGDFIDLAAFSSWDFYQDSAYGFHFFADENGKITHNYSVKAEETLNLKLIKGTKDYEYNSVFYDVADYEVFYGSSLYDATASVTTDGNACAEISFPSAGTYFLWVDGGYGNEYSEAIVSAPGYAKVTVTSQEEPKTEVPETPRKAQDVSTVLNATMTKLVSTVTEPTFGTNAGEWTVFGLARGGYFEKDNAYFTNYYNRIVETVNNEATSVNMNGALHKNKSTENSRLIVALSAIGKDATSVGDYDLVEAYSANGFSWIKKQGLNGTIWALIALDSNNYETSDATIRQQCVNEILAAQHDDGGWALQANKSYASDPDITGMTLTALYPYREQNAVAEACEKAIAWLAEAQNDDGTYSSGGAKCSESCAWVIVATTTWGINPDTDARFIKNGKSVVDGLLAHYLEDQAEFQHIIGAGANNMATDQSCYGLVAYDRFVNGKTGLYDYSDVTFEKAEGNNPETPIIPTVSDMKLTVGLPERVEGKAGTTFNAVLSINKWDNEAEYKVIDFIATVPTGLEVTSVTAGSNLTGGEVSYWLEGNANKLRVVYMDTNSHSNLTMNGESFPTELFTIGFKVKENVVAAKDGSTKQFDISIDGMSVKLSSDSSDPNAMIVVDTDKAYDSVAIVTGVTYSAMCLYTGDDIDLIPSTKKAVVVAVTGIKESSKLTFNDGKNTIEFKYNPEITGKTGIDSYIALVDASVTMDSFLIEENYTLETGEPEKLNFGDSNADNVVNAQDALAAVNFWIRKGEAPSDDQILSLNVNGDSRLNTFDALGIVEMFVNDAEYTVLTKAATLATNIN